MRTLQELADTLDGVTAQINSMEKDRAKLLDKVTGLRDQLQEADYGLRNTDTVLKNLQEQKSETMYLMEAKLRNERNDMEGRFDYSCK